MATTISIPPNTISKAAIHQNNFRLAKMFALTSRKIELQVNPTASISNWIENLKWCRHS